MSSYADLYKAWLLLRDSTALHLALGTLALIAGWFVMEKAIPKRWLPVVEFCYLASVLSIITLIQFIIWTSQ